MARRLQLGSPVGEDAEARWRWIEESLRQIERASHEDNLGGVDEAFDLIKVAATSTYSGVVELATVTEVLTGTDAERAVTPDALAGLWEEGPDITWASTISVGEGGYFHVIASSTTGSIAAIDFGTQKDGRSAILKFDSPGTLVYSSGLVLPTTGVNITVSSGDCAHVVQDSSVVSRVVNYQRSDGTAVTVSSAPAVTFADSSTISWSTSGSPYSAEVIAPLPVARGGTGQITAAEAVGELIQACSTMSTADRIADLVGAYDASGDTGAATEFWRTSGHVVLASGTVSNGATLDIPLDTTGYSNFKTFKLVIHAVPATDSVQAFVRFSDDGGATFEADAADYAWAATETDGGVVADVSDSEIELVSSLSSNIGNASGEGIQAEIIIFNPAATTVTRITWTMNWQRADAVLHAGVGGGQMLVAGASTDIQFLFSSGNIATAYWSLVGIQ